MNLSETAHLAVQLDLKGNLNAGLSNAARALQNFDKHTSNTQRSLGKLVGNLERGIAIGATAAVGGFVAVAKAAGDFEAQLNTIGTIVDRGELKGIGESLRKTARDTGLSLDDLTSAYYDLASAGVKGALATSVLNDAVALGIGGLATTAQTVDLLTTAVNAYGLDAAGAAKATDQFALAVADGKVKADQIAASFANVASIAKTYKVGIDQIAASYAYLTAQGVPAEEVTTEMQRAIISLAKPLPALQAAQKALGVTFTDEVAKKGLVPALQELRVYADKNKIPLIELLGRIEAVKYVLQTTGPNFAGFNAELVKMGSASGTAAQQMADRQQGLNFQLARLKALAKDAGITIGSALLPKLTPLVEKLNQFISNNQDKIANFGTKLADAFTKFAEAVQKVDWQPFIDGLRVSSDIAKTAINLFMSLPAEVKAAAIGAFAVNKLTGGLPTAIAKDIGGTLIGQLAGRGSSPANPLWVAQVPLPGGPPIPTGPVAEESLLSKAAKLLGVAGAGLMLSQDTIAAGVEKGVIDANGHVILPGTSDPNITAGGFDMRQVVSPDQAELNARRIEAAENRTTMTVASSGSKVVQQIDALHKQFRTDLAGLKAATKAIDIAKFARHIAHEITHGVGSAAGTRGVLADLHKKLTETHDPRTAAILRTAIAQVEAKLPNREFVQQQLTEAKRIAGSTETAKQKLADLASIQKTLRAHGDTNAAKQVAKLADVGRKIDSAKTKNTADTRSETAGIRAAIQAQKLAVTVINYTSVSLRDLTLNSKSAARLGHIGGL